MANPVLVERLLRERFDTDDKLYVVQRQEAERARSELLAAKKDGASSDKLLALLKQKHSNAVTETNWQLGTRDGRIAAKRVTAKRKSLILRLVNWKAATS